jgi:carbonic anhydrase
MKKIITGINAFRRNDVERHRALYERLAAEKQRPLALFITCSDSRIVPHRITGTDPGDLFVLRNAGNLVPPHGASSGGESATIEYALGVLGVGDVIVCGHSECGAVRAMLDADTPPELPAVAAWLRHAEATRRIVGAKHGHLDGARLVEAAVQENVLVQLRHLETHPAVAARLATGGLRLHGWYYDIASGRMLRHDAARHAFVDIESDVVSGRATTAIDATTGLDADWPEGRLS